MIEVLQLADYLCKDRQEEEQAAEREAVRAILADVQAAGDRALKRCTLQYDGVALDDLRIPDHAYERAYRQVTAEFLTALRQAHDNIRRFHQAQTRTSLLLPDREGNLLGQIVRPLRRVGIYVPGGRAAYPSSVLMNAVPAQVAGVREIVLVTPPDRAGEVDPHVLVTIRELGIAEAYRVGGAQAIGALAYGTETIRPVDKITGPGNLYVALAKQEVFGKVAIDMIAGPSEVMIVADDSADPDYVAADMLAQAEHDPRAAAICVTPSPALADRVARALAVQIERLPRKEIAAESLAARGAIVLTDDLEQAFALVDRMAPEHLELLVEDALSWAGRVENAGAIFVGPYSPEPVGDYFAGPNHTLPTAGTARFSSPLSVDDFIKKSSLICYGKESLLRNGHHVIALAEAEGLTAHAQAIRVRLAKEGRERNDG
ncbi:histidinol dehydrogenase [Tumebacillus lipolyticus]|uniref:Histidinol dehydrogenase n=1 Tax=Tumebacillus lipolyticus TaxID=1280370 RepID=A0ABW5A161_9BACL